MKKLIYLLASVVWVVLVVSCDKNQTDDLGVAMKVATINNPESTPTSAGGCVPVTLNVDKPRGGNVTCNDVGEAIMGDPAYFDLCGDRINYEDSDFDGMPDFNGLPADLNVVVDGNFISFDLKGKCIKIGEKFYKVGAVIVKGSNSANVYFYEGGSLGDSGLAAPGGKHMVSNLTFCFIECEQQELIIAVKSLYRDGTNVTYCESFGTLAFFNSAWCGTVYLGVNDYPSTASFHMGIPSTNTIVGEVTVIDGDVTVTLAEGKTLMQTSLFIGTLEDLQTLNLNANGCPDYTDPAYWTQNFTASTDINGHSFMFFDL